MVSVEPKKILILNLNRVQGNRTIRKVLKRAGGEAKILIVDLLWHPPFQFKDKTIPRFLLGRKMSYEFLLEDISLIGNAFADRVEAAPPKLTPSQIIHDGIDVWPLFKFNIILERLEESSYFFAVRRIIDDFQPDLVWVIEDGKLLSSLVSDLIRSKNIPMQTFSVDSLTEWLKKRILKK